LTPRVEEIEGGISVHSDSGSNWRIFHADAVRALAAIPAGSVHCAVTSPPYWGLRDYGAEGQIGLEEWLARIVEVFQGVHRVLRDDGTLWLNLGDAYTHSGSERYPTGDEARTSRLWGSKQTLSAQKRARAARGAWKVPEGLKTKEMMGLPWRVAFALQAAGWYLRSEIIWSKTNPMPESVHDRPTRAHETLFLLSKRPSYYYDADAIREPFKPASLLRLGQKRFDGQTGGAKDYGNRTESGESNRSMRKSLRNQRARMEELGFNPETGEGGGLMARNKRSVWEIATVPFREEHFATYPPKLVEPCVLAGTSQKGVCSECGAPWFRVSRASYANDTTIDGRPARGNNVKGGREQGARSMASGERTRRVTGTLGWCPGCRCDGSRVPSPPSGFAPTDRAEREAWYKVQEKNWQVFLGEVAEKVARARPTEPARVLDPFSGTGTTGEVALEHGRRYLGIEIDPKAVRLSTKRLARRHLQEHLIP